MTVKFREVGNSITVTIPKTIVKQFGLKQGMEANVNAENDFISVKPLLPPNKITIKQLFCHCTGDYKPSEFNWGEPVGREIW